MLDIRSRAQILRDILQASQDANIPGLAQGQLIRNIGTLFADESVNILEQVRYALSSGFLSTASGPFLDILGESIFGLSRKIPTAAFAQASDQNIEFYVTTNDLATYLPLVGDVGEIADGTTISDDSNNVFLVSPRVLVPAGVQSVFVSVEAELSGRVNSVPAGVLINHTLSSSINVRNLKEINNGTELESDNNYRFRLSKAHLAMQGGNNTAIENAIVRSPGVKDYSIYDGAFGPGTTEVLLIPTGNRLSVGTKQMVAANVRAVKAAGTNVIVSEPDYVEFELDITLLSRNAGIQIEGPVESRVRQALYSYFANLDIGATFNTADIEQAARESAGDNIANAKISCFLLNQQLVPAGTVELASRDLLVPYANATEPIRVFVT